ncbi:MAG: hypothetical protein AABN33_29375 [Acidobacteriota bacterium]
MNLVSTLRTLVLVALLLGVAAAQQKQPPVQPSGGSAPSGPAPLLVIESFTHDFGEVKPGDPLRYAFKIKNEGKADLLINSVSPG